MSRQPKQPKEVDLRDTILECRDNGLASKTDNPPSTNDVVNEKLDVVSKLVKNWIFSLTEQFKDLVTNPMFPRTNKRLVYLDH